MFVLDLNGEIKIMLSRLRPFIFIVVAFFLFVSLSQASRASEERQAPEKTNSNNQDKIRVAKENEKMQKAIFGAGCFWGVEETFRHIPGVVSTSVGYTGGAIKNPTYQDVCSGQTGHTEAIEIIYDPEKVSYKKLLDVFFENHDPTTPNRQGPDIGYQYRSVIFYTTPEQETLAHAEKEKLSSKYKNPIATAIEPAKEFYKAEEYHQRYLEKKGLKVCH